MIKRLLALALVAAFVGCATVDPDTYKPLGHRYGRADGWYVDSSDNVQLIIDGTATGAYFDSSGNFTTNNTVAYTNFSATGTATVTGATALNGGLAMDTDKFTVADTTGNTVVGGTLGVTGATTLTGASTHTGDATFSGGAGAITCGAANCSVLATDNSATGLDVGSTGKTNMIRLQTTNGAESVQFMANVIKSPAVWDTFGEGNLKGIFNLQIDGTAYDGTAGVANLIHTSNGNVYAWLPIVGQTLEPAMTATGLNIAADQVDNDGVEIYGGVLGASGRPFVIGTDPAFKFCATLTIADASGTDDLHIGFRGMQTATAGVDDYTDVASLAIITNANPAAIYVATALNNAAMAETNTTDTWADGASKEICTLVSNTGVVTFTNAGSAPTVTAAYTFDDGDLVIPFIQMIQHGDLTEAVDITEWDVAYQ